MRPVLREGSAWTARTTTTRPRRRRSRSITWSPFRPRTESPWRSSAAGEPSSVDADDCPGGERGLIRQQPPGGGGDLLRLSEPAHRDEPSDSCAVALLECGEALGQDRPRSEYVDAYSASCVIEGRDARQSDDGVL